MRKALILSLALATLAGTATASELASHKPGIWSIEPTQAMDRWVVIHNLQSARADGLYHIEVIGRKKGDATWQIVHLAPHMAITENALQQSIQSPLQKGAVYPETHNSAFATWQKENNSQGGSICTTSVVECL